MKQILIPLALLCLCCVSCGRSSKADTLTHEGARLSAERYYIRLLEGNYEDYVAGMVNADSMPPLLRSQMTDLMAQYMNEQRAMGLMQVTAKSDSLQDSLAHVFLTFQYKDSLQENVCLPMVFQNGKWRIL